MTASLQSLTEPIERQASAAAEGMLSILPVHRP
jgi:hypothetical protein